MTRTNDSDKFLNSLVQDCITYRLDTTEALKYIEIKFHKISLTSYKMRKSKALSQASGDVWLSYFTRVGFVLHHKRQIEDVQKIQEDSFRQLLVETKKAPRDENKICKLKYDIRENARLLSELGLGTPVISGIKQQLKENADAQRIPNSR